MKRFCMGLGLLLFGMIYLLNSASPRLYAQPSGAEIYKECINSAVWIVNRSKEGTSMGSGSMIDIKQKLFLTNYHVVGDSPTVILMFPTYNPAKELITEKERYWEAMKQNQGYVAKILFAEKRRDLAVVQIIDPKPLPKHVKPVTINTKGPNPGEKIFSIGSPGASENLWIYTPGDCRQVGVKKWLTGGGSEFFEVEAKTIESTSPTNPGDSGGPLFNSKGHQVGVTQGGSTKNNAFSYFIHISEMVKMCEERKLKVNYQDANAEGGVTSTEAVMGTVDPKNLKNDTPKDVVGKKDDPTQKKDAAPKADEATEKKATTELNVAKSLMASGKKELARNRLEKVIASFPTTKAAQDAKLMLKELDK